MRSAHIRLRTAALAAALGCLALAWPGPSLGQPSIRSVLVAPPEADPVLDQIAEGYAAWLRSRIRGADLTPIPREALRAGEGRLGSEEILERAGELGATYSVLPDLRFREGEIEIRLRLYDTASKELFAVARDSAAMVSLGTACESTAERLLVQLGVPEGSIADALPPLLDELASTTRALHFRDAGKLARAWREVEGKLSPTAMRLRKQIAAEAHRPEIAVTERARVLAATGDAPSAWSLIAAEVSAATSMAELDPELLLAAAEVQLARGNPREARAYLEALAAREPGNADAQLGLARALELQNDTARARRALSRAAKLEPSDPRPLSLLAKLESGDPKRQAQILLSAGRRNAQRLNPHRAERLLESTVELDPSLGAESWSTRAELRERLGQPAQALEAYREVVATGEADATTWKGIGRAHRQLGSPASEKAFRKALHVDPDDAEALRELGVLYERSGRTLEAIPVLERALELAPSDTKARISLARALRATGDLDHALEILTMPEASGADSPEVLSEIARIRTEKRDYAGARRALERAIHIDPLDAELHEQLAQIHQEDGQAAAAQQERQLVKLLEGESGSLVDPGEASLARGATSFDELLLSFASEIPHAKERLVAHLGLREGPAWKRHLLAWTHPRIPARDAIEAALNRAIGRRFSFAPPPDFDLEALEEHFDRLYAFGEKTSLSADSISIVNQTLGTDAVFLARIERALPLPSGVRHWDPSCGTSDHFELEFRMLAGQDREIASILANVECLSASVDAYGMWNPRALGLYAVLAVLILLPLLRGWGTIVVEIELPPRTKGFLSISITKTEDGVKQEKPRGKRFSDRLQRTLRSLSRYEKRMAGRETVFRWIPARQRPYTVTLRGPLVDARGEEIIGHFLEQRKARVSRRKPVRLRFDLCPSECAVEVEAMLGGAPARGARVAVRGDPASLRYAREGEAYVYLPKGKHVILIGLADRVGEYPVDIRSLEKAIPLVVDLEDERGLLFAGCPEAVDPYLQGDLETAAGALEATGNQQATHRVRAALYQRRGELDRAAAEFEAGGELEQAAELRANDSDPVASAALFERAGDYARAAETYRGAGDGERAAAAYEAAYDYENALDCYREIGNTEKVIDLLEKTGEYLDAASLARECGNADRAIHNIQQISAREDIYGEACAMLAEILSEREEHDLAADKFREALEAAGGERATVAMHERYASLLERAGRREQALEAYQKVLRRDPRREDAATRLAALRTELTRAPEGAVTRVSPRGAAQESRYELLEEIGRGGMGVVYKARDKRLKRLVALKHLPESLRDHPEAVKLFLREAQAAAALNHRNIVTLFDAGEENGTYFITMELLEGMPLSKILARRQRLNARDVARLGIQIGAGLHYAQKQRIVHRDIKTANLFFASDRVVKIMDFGLAKTIEEVRRSSTVIGGTPYFMAPEQAAGEAVDHRVDLYALGVTFFHLVTGSVPFREGDLAYHHRHTPPPDPRELVRGLPDAMAELILQLMAKDPAGRPASGGEVAARLEAFLKG